MAAWTPVLEGSRGVYGECRSLGGVEAVAMLLGEIRIDGGDVDDLRALPGSEALGGGGGMQRRRTAVGRGDGTDKETLERGKDTEWTHF